MAENAIQRTWELLRRYGGGSVNSQGPLGAWETLVHVVVSHGRKSRRGQGEEWSWFRESPMNSPEEALVASPDCLEAHCISPRTTAALQSLAKWWIKRIGRSAPPEVWFERQSSWQEELRRLPGVNWELADRILLFVGGVLVYPLDRGSMRIAARHGWVDGSAEYEEWQGLFVRGAQDGGSDLAELSLGMARIGREFCGSAPKCDECPLRPLLPASGPVAIGDTSDE